MQPLRDLVNYLIQDERTQTDVGEARAIFRWIAANHVSKFRQDTEVVSGSAYSHR